MKTLPKFALALAAVASLAGCVSVPDNAGQDPSDPWEKMNRNTFAFNQKLDIVRWPRAMNMLFRNMRANASATST